MKAWAFYRRSTDKQELSIEDQKREVVALAVKHGWKIVREFVPARGYASGLTIDRDPVFLEMARLAEFGGHGVRYLLIYDVSRFGRLNPEDKLGWEWFFKRHGIQVIYAKDDFKNDGSLGDGLLKFVKHSEAHEYSRKLSELTLRGAKSHARLGHFTGGQAPYGYDRLLVDQAAKPVRVLKRGEWKDNTLCRVVLLPSPTEAPVVRSIFESYATGRGLNTIVADLNARKLRPPRGLHWAKPVIHYMLRNRVYLGEQTYNKRSYKGYRRGEKVSLMNPKDDWITVENAHEAIIDRDLFDRVRAKCKTWKVRVNGAERKPYLLTGLTVCSHCGYKITGSKRRSGKGYEAFTYVCSGYHRIGKSVCSSFYLHTEQLDSLAVTAIRDHLNDPTYKQAVRDVMPIVFEKQYGPAAEQGLEEIKIQITKVSKEIDNLVGAVRDGVISPALVEALKNAEALRDDLKQQLCQTQAKLAAKGSPQGLMAKLLHLADDFEILWLRCGTPESKKDFMRRFIHQINLNRENASMSADFWIYRFPGPLEIDRPSIQSGRPAVSTQVYCGGPCWT